MGGLVFVVAALLVSAVFALIFAQFTPMFITAWWVLAMYSLIGFLDDFMKIFSQKSWRA